MGLTDMMAYHIPTVTGQATTFASWQQEWEHIQAEEQVRSLLGAEQEVSVPACIPAGGCAAAVEPC